MKYIVYITINIVNKKIYIGVHKTMTPYEFDGYLGDGVYVNDRYSYQHKKEYFARAVNKYGPKNFIRKTLEVFSNLQDALDLEHQLVDEEFVKRSDTYNLTVGGGMPPINTKVIYQYDLEGNFIKEWPSITEASLHYKCNSSSIGQAIFDRTPSIKFLWSETKYDKLDINNFKIDENKTKCYLYNINGEFIQEFKSISDCAKDINSDIQTVSKAIKGKYCINKTYYCSDLKLEKFNVIRESHKNCPVYQYDLDGNFIQMWDSVSELKKMFTSVNVCDAINRNISSAGYLWSWEKVKSMTPYRPSNKARKVGKYTKEGELVQVFNTVREAKSDTCGAPNVLSGKRKTAGGFIWKYLDD